MPRFVVVCVVVAVVVIAIFVVIVILVIVVVVVIAIVGGALSLFIQHDLFSKKSTHAQNTGATSSRFVPRLPSTNALALASLDIPPTSPSWLARKHFRGVPTSTSAKCTSADLPRRMSRALLPRLTRDCVSALPDSPEMCS